MKTIMTIERNVRKAVFTSIWKFFGVKDLTGLAILVLAIGVSSAAAYVFMQGFLNWLYR